MWWTPTGSRLSWGCRPLPAWCVQPPADTEPGEPQHGRENTFKSGAQRRQLKRGQGRGDRWRRRKGGWGSRTGGRTARGRTAHLFPDADRRIFARPLCSWRRLHGGPPKPTCSVPCATGQATAPRAPPGGVLPLTSGTRRGPCCCFCCCASSRVRRLPSRYDRRFGPTSVPPARPLVQSWLT